MQLLIAHYQYKNFLSNEKQTLNAHVITQYPKKDYMVLKLKSNDLTFYTTTREKIKDLSGYDVQLLLFLNSVDISFIDYITTFYAPSYILKAYSSHEPAVEFIQNQHPNSASFSEFYEAIFLAKPLSKQLRDIVASLGVSHLIALSGFHLGILSAILYFLMRPPYRYLHTRFFPYRHELFDLGLVVAVVLGIYLFVTDFPPSLIRAYAMLVFGWVFVLLGVSILTYSFLFFVVTVLAVLDPSLLFSLSFFFSVSGVFYIYLLLDWLKTDSKILTTLAITVWVFIMMLPITHYFFDVTSLYQLLSLPLTLLFTLFYPFALFMHAIGAGHLLEFPLPQNIPTYAISTPAWFYYLYIALSLLAINDRFKLPLLLTAAGFSVWLFVFSIW
ncbi:MAG: ComEC/Rec2 family competence protein [Campylobacterota bacterium]